MIDVRENFEAYRKEIENAALPVDVATAQRATAAHVALRKKIVNAPIDFLQSGVQRVSSSSLCIIINIFFFFFSFFFFLLLLLFFLFYWISVQKAK